VHLQILSVAARSRNGIIPAHCGALYFYRRLFLLSYKTLKKTSSTVVEEGRFEAAIIPRK